MCSKETVHCFTVVINSFLWIAGIALVTVGLVNFSQQSGLPLPQEVMFKTVSLGVLVDGLLLLVLEAVAFFAQLPVGKRNLKIFAALLTFLVICETFFVFFVVAVTASVCKTTFDFRQPWTFLFQSRQDIFETVSSYVILYYADSASQASMDQLQNQLKCCGVYTHSDYIPKAPETCLDQNRVTYTRGCIDMLEELRRTQCNSVIGVLIPTAVCQVLTISGILYTTHLSDYEHLSGTSSDNIEPV
ncbi:hypothetical protein CRM22_000820 [Opisthorchis felineus]|uniref:Tetraspanin n=1 Tax=Opisthorchis felineus TaxID=147828 RepID=A0A4S2MDB3_OPIFE|nr:hypothetical protein CRM22_000820 [Opisthorchis felineus]